MKIIQLERDDGTFITPHSMEFFSFHIKSKNIVNIKFMEYSEEDGSIEWIKVFKLESFIKMENK